MLNTSKIWSIINSKELTNQAIADIIGVSEATVRYRKDTNKWLADEIEKLAYYFNKPLDWFFSKEEPHADSCVGEPEAVYGCRDCKQKDLYIEALRQNNQLLVEKNHDLQERLGLVNEKIGKAG